MAAPICSDCGPSDDPVELVDGLRVYPHRPDLGHKHFWRCSGCGAFVGCHPGTTDPLGTPAGAETRRARTMAHEVFDPMWKVGGMKRRDAYRWLTEAMGMTREACHIGMMTADQAREVVRLVYTRRKNIRSALK